MKCLYLIMFLFVSLSIFGQKVETVEASYIYCASESESIEQAKQVALQRAQIEAIANAFGMVISQQNITRMSNKNGESDIDFQSISLSDTNGEWIETIGDPKFVINYEQGMLIVICSVKGKIRQIDHSKIDISIKILRNGTEDKFESSEFRSGDDLFVSFQSPVDGYLTIYLVDSKNNAFCLLPYRNQSDGVYKISANKHYRFFSLTEVESAEKDFVDEYTMTCERDREINHIYIIFSPNHFVKANDNDMGEILPREIDGKSFQKWLTKVRNKDKYVNFYSKQISISKE